MEMVNYCIIAGMSVIFQLGCLVHLRENDIFSVKTINKFRLLVIVLIFQIIIDCVFFQLEGKNVATLFLYIIKCTELIINPVLILLVFDIFYDKRKKRRDKVLKNIRTIILFAIAILMLMFAIFNL